MERDAWIMVAAQVPHLIDFVMVKKHEDLDDPDMVKLYSLVSGALDGGRPRSTIRRVVEVADILERLVIRAAEAGELGTDDAYDDQFVDLLDATLVESSHVPSGW